MPKHIENPHLRACQYCQASFHIDDPDNVTPKAGFHKGLPLYPHGVCADCEQFVPDPREYDLNTD